MSPIIVENMVMANIIVTPEKNEQSRKGISRRARTAKTIILRHKLVRGGFSSTQTYGWKVLVGLKKNGLTAQAFQRIPFAGQF